MKRAVLTWSVATALTCGGWSTADTITLTPLKDNTLYEEFFGILSNARGDHFFVGATNGLAIRRGLIMFDVASAIPPGSTITAVTLRLVVTRTRDVPVTVGLNRALADWGEGESNAGSTHDGGGGGAGPGDATWRHRFFDTVNWRNLGGDFSATPSAEKTVGSEGSYTWGSTPGMVADVQDWLNTPATNFGWFVKTNESVIRTAKQFASRENSVINNRPRLTITYTPPVGGDADGDGDVDLFDFAEYLNCVVGQGTSRATGGCMTFDFDHDADIDFADLGAFQRAFTGD